MTPRCMAQQPTSPGDLFPATCAEAAGHAGPRRTYTGAVTWIGVERSPIVWEDAS